MNDKEIDLQERTSLLNKGPWKCPGKECGGGEPKPGTNWCLKCWGEEESNVDYGKLLREAP